MESMEVIASLSGLTLEEFIAHIRGKELLEKSLPDVKVAEDAMLAIDPYCSSLPQSEAVRLLQMLVAKLVTL